MARNRIRRPGQLQRNLRFSLPLKTRVELTLSSPRAFLRWESDLLPLKGRRRNPIFGAAEVFSFRKALGNPVGVRRRREESGRAQDLGGGSGKRGPRGDPEGGSGPQLPRCHREGRD